MTLASFSPQAALPSPTTAVWQLGPVPIRAYALCIVLGIVVAALVMEYRLRRRGVAPWASLDIAVWAVPFGIVGARIYHVITSPQAYFGEGGKPIEALYIWQGGLGIWGAVAGGAVGAWLAVRQLGLPLTVVADALAPGLVLAQAVGRIGNWFNNELFGGPTTLPWGLEIHRMDSSNPGHALRDDTGKAILEPGLFHPTFAYEALWNIGVAILVLLADRRFKLGKGRAFALYVMAYTAGRAWIELIRTDEANEILGVRLNVWTAVLVFLGALIYFVRVRGPQEYLVPVGGIPAELPAASPEKSDVSQVDLTRRPAAVGVPVSYRVVSEEQFRVYNETGEVPPEPAGGSAASGDADADDQADPLDDGRDDAAEHGDDATEPGNPDARSAGARSAEAQDAGARSAEAQDAGALSADVQDADTRTGEDRDAEAPQVVARNAGDGDASDTTAGKAGGESGSIGSDDGDGQDHADSGGERDRPGGGAQARAGTAPGTADRDR